MNKILTVSIAAYNVENYLRETLESFMIDDIFSDIEILIVNDGSSDNTLSIANEYCNKYPDVYKVINKQNGGWGSTVNEGITHATGKYFKQLDGDDYFNKNNMVQFINILKNVDADLVYTNFIEFDDLSGQIIKEVRYHDVVEKTKLYLEDVEINFSLAMHSCTFKTEILKKNNIVITEHCFYTDIEYLLKAFLNVKTIMFYPINVYCYRLGREGQSASVSGYRKHYKEHAKIVLLLLDMYYKTDMNKNMRKIYFDRMKSMVDAQYHQFLNLEPTGIHAKELQVFDKKIKNRYPEFYPNTRKRIILFRKIGRLIYPVITYKTKI